MAPDLMLGWIPMLTEPGPKGPRISRQSGVTCYAHPMRPESKGHVHIIAADPRRPPAINFNFLSSPPDAEPTVRAVRIARAIMTAPAMAPFQVSEVAPGADRTADDEILDWVKNAAETTYHPVGTCSWCRDWRDLNGKAKVLDAADEAKDLLAFRTAVEVLARGGPRRRKPMYRRENRTPDGETAHVSLARGFEPWL